MVMVDTNDIEIGLKSKIDNANSITTTFRRAIENAFSGVKKRGKVLQGKIGHQLWDYVGLDTVEALG